ncbi:hypothetical protein [Altibacter sp.]|uniref:hypothetical protein n=1 Tax=Altibacter sp. TaxID=2024823 RepID=UPI000C8DCE51|nr:hypothetical protein [Altibacter sp.]MAP54762.1 hypothetical protein [Altibacter sp.]
MQTIYTSFKKSISLAFAGISALLLTACGTYNNGYGDSDGIYNSETEVSTTTVEDSNEKASYYKQYFESKDKAFEDLPEENLIFTDIEAYTTTESIDEDGYIIVEESDYEEGYGAWGDNPENITVNVYNNGGFGWYGHGWFNPYWYGGYWGNPFYWNNPYWNIGFGWGYPFYGYYGWGHPFYYGGFYGGFYNPYYGYGGYNNIAFNRGRRNLDYGLGRSSTRGRSNATNGRDSYSRSELNRRSNVNSTRRSSRFNGDRTSNIRRNSTISRPRTNSSRNNNVFRPNTSRSNSNTIRNNRSSRPNVSRSSSGSRSSGSMRSSGSSSRSSGSRGGGGRRGGGRG